MTGESSNCPGKVWQQEVTKESPPDHKSDQEDSEDEESLSEVNCKILYILLLTDIYAQHIYLCFK